MQLKLLTLNIALRQSNKNNLQYISMSNKLNPILVVFVSILKLQIELKTALCTSSTDRQDVRSQRKLRILFNKQKTCRNALFEQVKQRDAMAARCNCKDAKLAQEHTTRTHKCTHTEISGMERRNVETLP